MTRPIVILAVALTTIGCAHSKRPRSAAASISKTGTGAGLPALRDQVSTLMMSTFGVRMKGTKDGKEVAQVLGSGVAISEDEIETCAHVLGTPGGWQNVIALQVANDATWVRDGEPHWQDAKVGSGDVDHDLATIKLLEATKLQPVEREAPSDVAIGDDVFFIGHPLALSPALGVGVLSGREPGTWAHDGRETQIVYLRIDGSVNGGNSGGGIFSRQTGKLIGIVNAKAIGTIDKAVSDLDDPSRATIMFGNVNPMVVIKEGFEHLAAQLQLGVGYAIPIDLVR